MIIVSQRALGRQGKTVPIFPSSSRDLSIKLTLANMARAAKNAAGKADYIAWDEELAGFGLRVLSDAELVAIWKACPDSDYGRIVKLLILTGQRREEIGGLKHSEIVDDSMIALTRRAAISDRPRGSEGHSTRP